MQEKRVLWGCRLDVGLLGWMLHAHCPVPLTTGPASRGRHAPCCTRCVGSRAHAHTHSKQVTCPNLGLRQRDASQKCFTYVERYIHISPKLFYYLNLVKLKHCLGTFLKSLIILQFSQQLLSETLNVSARSTVSPFPPLCAYSRARPFVCMCHRCLEEKRTFPTLLTLVSHVLYVALCRESSEAGLCKVRNSS